MSVVNNTHLKKTSRRLSLVEVCAGAGGLTLGLERAGFDPVLLVEQNPHACDTLSLNRPEWPVARMDVTNFDPCDYPQVYDVDLLAAGTPRLASMANPNKPDGNKAELKVLHDTVMLIHGIQPRAVLVENVPALVNDLRLQDDRLKIEAELRHLGYCSRWFIINAIEHGVHQRRPHGILVAFKGNALDGFKEPERLTAPALTVGEVLLDSMSAGGWPDVMRWSAHANQVAPTIVGGSEKHGGPDLGPTGTKKIWARLGINGSTVAGEVPGPDFRWDPNLEPKVGMMPLTTEQVAILQGFPADWNFAGKKTRRFRQIGNACPPPLAEAIGRSIYAALGKS
ncbi:DNA cytosine methyltransferase [Pseudonocardiaceae bacterium YIM PH 21723]|nr:DNA cytosine methyltransferase [Pseudonocardiaceae bacterium YIM PH 21723]